MPKKLEECVKKVKKQGKSQSSAWAICKDSLNMEEGHQEKDKDK